MRRLSSESPEARLPGVCSFPRESRVVAGRGRCVSPGTSEKSAQPDGRSWPISALSLLRFRGRAARAPAVIDPSETCTWRVPYAAPATAISMAARSSRHAVRREVMTSPARTPRRPRRIQTMVAATRIGRRAQRRDNGHRLHLSVARSSGRAETGKALGSFAPTLTERRKDNVYALV